MDKQKRNVLVALADKNYVDQAKQFFSSVYFNSGWDGDYLLMTNDIDDKDLIEFKNKNIIIYKIEHTYNLLDGTPNNQIAVFGKFELFKEYFKQWNKIIFIDTDVIVNAPLDNLLKLSGFNAPKAPSGTLQHFINGNYIELADEFIQSDNELYHELSMKYDLKSNAFNPSTIVFDTNIIESNTYLDILALYRKFGKLNRYKEESTLNLFFYQKWGQVPVIYNTVPTNMEIIHNIDSRKNLPIISHFIGNTKPWEYRISKYYSTWKDNLEKFKSINLSNRKTDIKNYSDEEIKKYTNDLDSSNQSNKILIIYRFFIYRYLVDIKRKLYRYYNKFNYYKRYYINKLKNYLNSKK